MANTIIHKAASRGFADHGWLKANHTFSFANYYNPERMHFGVLRVLNDDQVAGGKGFGTHPHDNMEIITIPLSGDLEHKDSMGNGTVIKNGDIQVMSAGTGIMHSEFNANADENVNLLQIWIFPNKKNVVPRYQQISLSEVDRVNTLQQILSPDATDSGVWIHQESWFHLGKFEIGKRVDYTLKKEGNGVYVFIISGSVSVNGNALETRDGIGIWNTNQINIESLSQNSEILVMEIPMKL